MADPIKTATRIFNQFLSKADPASMRNCDPNAKDPEAQEAGRKGGLRGGRIRAKRLSASKKKLIARKAAKSRWRET